MTEANPFDLLINGMATLRDLLRPQITDAQSHAMDDAILACHKIKDMHEQLMSMNATLLRDLEDLESRYDALMLNDYL